MKLLSGSELVSYIKERQARQVRRLVQTDHTRPKLVIIRTNPDPVVDSYMKLKTSYGTDLGVEVEVKTIEQQKAVETINGLNQDPAVHGIIVQIPLPDPKQTTEILNTVDAKKDVDGLGEKTTFDAPTPMAISWLLAGYNVDFLGKKIVIVGHGRLVGKPLLKLWQNSGLNVIAVDKKTKDLPATLKQADIIVSATGVPGLITKDLIKPTAVIVDAGVATDKNGLVGDVAPDVRNMPEITITPEKGGVGPLTVAGLFENVIRSAERAAKK